MLRPCANGAAQPSCHIVYPFFAPLEFHLLCFLLGASFSYKAASSFPLCLLPVHMRFCEEIMLFFSLPVLYSLWQTGTKPESNQMVFFLFIASCKMDE